MSSHHLPQLLLLLLLPFSLLITPSHSCGIAVYWGQNGDEGSLIDACNSNLYQFVTVSFLTTFGKGQTPILNLDGSHCNDGDCRPLATEVRFCQTKGVKVLLSLGGITGNYGLSSPSDAHGVANYLWNNFLSGTSVGPLGSTELDGIDFHLEYPSSTKNWDVLAKALKAYSSPQKQIYISAAPYCPYPDPNLDTAITSGDIDFVWVKFYDNPPCDYSGGADALINSWKKWSASVSPTSKLFLGLPASPSTDVAESGFIDYISLTSKILPTIKNSKNYGGVMLWNRSEDKKNAYSQTISSAVCSAAGTKSEVEELLISQVV